MDAETEVDMKEKSFIYKKIHAKRDYADTTMSAASKLLTLTRLNSVSFSRLAELRAAHLDNCTARKDSGKASCISRETC